LLLLNSGGIDSCVAAYLNNGCVSLFIDFGEPNTKYARKAALRTAELYCSKHYEVKLKGIHQVETNSYTHIPMRGKLIWIIGVAKAWELGLAEVISGMKSDSNRDDAIDKFNAMTDTLIFPRPKVIPQIKNVLFRYKTIKDVLSVAPNVDITHTISCNKNPVCRKCYKCRERKELGIEEKR